MMDYKEKIHEASMNTLETVTPRTVQGFHVSSKVGQMLGIRGWKVLMRVSYAVWITLLLRASPF